MTTATLYTGTMSTDGPLFIGFLLAVVAIVTLLQYLPALALGPIAEHFHIFSRIDVLGVADETEALSPTEILRRELADHGLSPVFAKPLC